VELRNLTLKPEALQDLELPCTVKAGLLGRLTLKVCTCVHRFASKCAFYCRTQETWRNFHVNVFAFLLLLRISAMLKHVSQANSRLHFLINNHNLSSILPFKIPQLLCRFHGRDWGKSL
jgi:hypothetical protein